MLTDFGKFLRVIRMNTGDNADVMSKKLYISSSYLYLIENGKRRIPDDMEINILNAYDLSNDEKEKLHDIIQKEKYPNEDKIANHSNNNSNTNNTEKTENVENAESVELAESETVSSSTKTKPKWMIFAIIAAVVAILLVVLIIAIVNKKPNNNLPSTQESMIKEDYVLPEIPTVPTKAEMFEYEIHGNKVHITNYIGSDETVLIPEEIDGKKVSNIGIQAFKGNKTIKCVIMQDGLEFVDFEAFAICVNLEYVVIPDSVYYLGNGAFYGCYSLKEVELGDGISVIGQCAFSECYDLRKITIGKFVTKIEHHAFWGCYFLENVPLSEIVTFIDYNAFGACKSFENVILPDTVKKLGNYAFCENNNLKKLFIPTSVTEIGDEILCYSDNATIYCIVGSYAETYAKNNGYKYKIVSSPDDLIES